LRDVELALIYAVTCVAILGFIFVVIFLLVKLVTL